MKHLIYIFLTAIVLLSASCSGSEDGPLYLENLPVPPEIFKNVEKYVPALYEGDHFVNVSVPAEGEYGYAINLKLVGKMIGAGMFDGEPNYEEICHRGFDGSHRHPIYNSTKEVGTWVFSGPEVYSFEDFRVGGDLGYAGINVGPNTTGRTRYFYVEFGIAYNTPETEGLHLECQYCKDHPDEAIEENPDWLFYPANLLFKTVVIEQPPLNPSK